MIVMGQGIMGPTSSQQASRWPELGRRLNPFVWTLIWILAVALAALVHLAFFVKWPDHFIHEDSAAYLSEAQSILTGHYADDNGVRPYGVPFFLALLSKLFSPNILVFATAQHVLSIVSALLIAASIRLGGAPRIFALLAFLLASLYARTVHYDNTIGGETISVFLTSVAVFMAASAAFRGWPPLPFAVGIGVCLGTLMLCRSAAFGTAAVIILWTATMVSRRWIGRLGILTLIGGIVVGVYLTPTLINGMIGKPPNGTEALPAMSFPVAYSGDFDHGVHLDRKERARKFVNEKRAAETRTGWADAGEYQWPLDIIEMMREPNETRADIEKVMRDIFIETLTTPSTLWRHLSHHFLREMFFLLFDGNNTARRASTPEGYYASFTHRDAFPFFHSPTDLKSERLVYDNYAPPRALSWILPSADKLQAVLDELFSRGYAPGYDPEPFCCGLTISNEYDFRSGPICWLSGSGLILVILLLVNGRRFGSLSPLPGNLVSVGVLMIAVALANAAAPAFLVYGFNRYGYYVAPFMAGATGVLGAVLFVWIWPLAVGRRPVVTAGDPPMARVEGRQA